MNQRLHGIAILALSTAYACDTTEGDINSSSPHESIFHSHDDTATERAEAITYEYMFSRTDSALAGIDDIQIRRVFFDDRGQAHTRLVQTINDVPVFGAEAIAHLSADGQVRSVTDHFLRNIRINTTPHISEGDALEVAMIETGGPARLTQPSSVQLVILPRTSGARLTYRIQLSQFEAGFKPSMPVVFVDAHSGDIVWRYENLQTAQLSDADKRTHDMGTGTNYNAATIADSSDPIANDAHLHTEQTLNYFLNAHNRDSFSGTGTRVDSYVHYSSSYVNAFWDGTRLTYGDGDGQISNALTTLDIVAHEFGHGVTSYEANLIYANESGALNEATSDIFAAAVESAQGGSFEDIWLVGEDCWLAGDSLRNMADPEANNDYDYYPTRYTGSADNGGVHSNSGIANLFFHLLSEGGSHPRNKTDVLVSGIGISNAAAIWYRALTVHMGPSATFEQARVATVAAAHELEPLWAPAVNDAWDAVGVPFPVVYDVTIDEQSDLSGGQGQEQHFTAYDATGRSAIRFEISGGSGDVDLYVNYGSPPTESDYDCRPYLNGNQEECEFNPAQGGHYYVMLRGYTAYSGVSLSVTAAGGSGPSAEICDDNLDNDSDGDIDCADTDCATAPACLSWIELSATDFESGWGIYNDGGSDARRSSNDAPYAHEGTYCARIRDNSGVASSFFSDPLDLSGYTELEVDFWFYARGMENGEDFFVELWDGTSWNEIGRYVRGTDFSNNTQYNRSLTVHSNQVNFSQAAQIRFRNDASVNNDRVYIDDIVISVR